MNRLLISVFCAALLAGCVSTGVNVRDDQVTQFKQGQTTKADVIASLGRPTTTMRQADGSTTLIYSYTEAKARPETYIPFVGAFIGGADSRSNMVTLRFGADERLIDYTTASSEYGTDMGAGQIEPVPNQPRK